NGPSLRYAHVTASALAGERIVAMADVHVWDLAPGEVRSLKLTGNHPYAAHDRIEFQLDDLELST
ncbi:MAG: hypothetical protein M3O70_15030, partial [Actinomycetota bacterium]|nr:hypothetical protein [Actinomycetota bacterium]